MNRYEGTQGVALVECTNQKLQRYVVRTDIKNSEIEESPNGVTFIECRFDHKPTMKEVMDFVLSVINLQTDQKILSEFVWNGNHVWLSSENQTNFSAAEYTASNKGGINLPITFKLWESDDNMQPVYYTFNTAAELSDFYISAQQFIQQCINEGWNKKDNIDWTPYEKQLNEC